MAYNGKLPGKDEVASLIIDALRQDKKDVVINAEIQAEIDQPSFKAADQQINKLTKKRKVDIDTSKAEQKIKNLMEPLREVEREIKALGTSGANFNVAHNTIKRYEQLKSAVSEATQSINRNNKELIEAKKVIENIEAVIKGLDITVEKATKKRKPRQTKKDVEDIKSQTDAVIDQTEAIKHEADTMAEYGDTVGDVSQKIKEKIDVQQQHAKSTEAATKAQEKLNQAEEKYLKLKTRKDNNGKRIAGSYATDDGLFEVEHDADGWKVHRKNAAGLYELVNVYKTKNEIIHDAALIAEHEAYVQKKSANVITDAQKKIEQELLSLSGAYEDMSNRAGRTAKFAEQYGAMFKAVQGGALSAAEAIAQLNVEIDKYSLNKNNGSPVNNAMSQLDGVMKDGTNSVKETSDEVEELIELLNDIRGGKKHQPDSWNGMLNSFNVDIEQRKRALTSLLDMEQKLSNADPSRDDVKKAKQYLNSQKFYARNTLLRNIQNDLSINVNDIKNKLTEYADKEQDVLKIVDAWSAAKEEVRLYNEEQQRALQQKRTEDNVKWFNHDVENWSAGAKNLPAYRELLKEVQNGTLTAIDAFHKFQKAWYHAFPVTIDPARKMVETYSELADILRECEELYDAAQKKRKGSKIPEIADMNMIRNRIFLKQDPDTGRTEGRRFDEDLQYSILDLVNNVLMHGTKASDVLDPIADLMGIKQQDEAIKRENTKDKSLSAQIFDALKQIRELYNKLRDSDYSDDSASKKMETMRTINATISDIEHKQFPYIAKAFRDESFNPNDIGIDWATTDEELREMAESIAVYATTSKEELGELKLIKIDTSSAELLNGELKSICDNAGNAVDAYRGLANEAQSNKLLTLGHHSGATWFSTQKDVANGYTRGTDNLYRANLQSRRLFDIDANHSGWNNITFLGDGSDDVSKKITELYNKKKELKEETTRLAEANQIESQSYKDVNVALRRVTADYEYYSNRTDTPYGTHDTNWYAEYAKANGYDAFRIRNVYDTLQGGGMSDVIGVFSDEQIINVEKVANILQDNLVPAIDDAIKKENRLKETVQETTDAIANKEAASTFDTDSGQMAFIEGEKESVKSENVLQEEIKETNELLDGQISLEEHLAEVAKQAREQLEQQEDLSKIVSRDIIDKALKGVDAEGLLSSYGLQGDKLTQGVDLFKDLVGARYLGDSSPKSADDIFNELFEFVSENAQHTVEVVKTLQDFRERMKLVQIGIPENMEQTFAAEFTDTWNDFKKLYAIGGNSKNKKKLLTKSKYASTPENLMKDLLAENFGYVFDFKMMQGYNGSAQNSLRILLDAIQRAKDEFKSPNTQTVFGLGKDESDDFVVRLATAMGVVDQNILAIRSAMDNASISGDILADSAERAANATERQANAEKDLAAAADDAVDAKNRQNKPSESAVNVEEIIARDMSKALEKLRSAKDNETTLFSLKGVFEGEDLVKQAQKMVQNIAEQANLRLGSFEVEEDTIKVKLYNDELKVTVDQMYKLKAAAEDAESATLELTKTKYHQDVKALNQNPFDSESAQKAALSSIDKIRADAERAKYDLQELEEQAKDIASSGDVTKFNNELRNTQNKIQAIKNSTATKSSMNPLINMQRDMKIANTEIDTMQLKLDKLGKVDGVKKASDMIADMRTKVEEYNAATTPDNQQKAYNEYSDLRHSFKAQMEYINAAKALSDSQESAAKQVDPIREQYKSLVDIITKINSTNSNILKYQDKDGGSGLFSGYIKQLQSDKSQLMLQLQSITQEINSTLSDGFVQGTEYSLPLSSILSDDDWLAVSSFLNDTKAQASLTTEEIDKLVASLQKAQTIDVEAKAKVAEQFKSVQETYKQIMSLGNLDKSNVNYQAVGGMFADIMRYKDMLDSDPTKWTTDESANLQKLIDNFNKYGNILVQVGQKEEKYFADKARYTQNTTMSGMAEDAEKSVEQIDTVQQKLTNAAKAFAQESGSDAIITNFAKTADGISRLDFSVFDTATGSLRNFRMEMGSVTNGMYITETTVNKSLANIQAAQKQLRSIGDLIGRLGATGVNVGEETAPAQVQKLLTLYQQLSSEINKGGNSDQGIIADLTRRSKMAASEVEKLYKQMLQMESAIENGQATGLGVGDPTGNVYGQLVEQAKKLAETQPGATLEIGKFDKATNTLNASLTYSSGAVEEFQIKMNGLSGQMSAQQLGIGKLTTSWDKFKTSISSAGKHLMTALVGYNVFFKAISEVRKGIGYVKEIDLALTELKKVTDETEESYRKFLKTAAGTAGEIGSTVSDFTEATANFARLGYTISESADMAKTAIVYRNVADGLDTVEQATDSIISTMKAFGIESDNTMGIVDRFNEVGNSFAITSAGIGEALQRSASALFAGGNTIDESIALVTAANSVIQNPEQVGTALKTLALRLRGAKVELEEAGLETENMAESTSTLQAKLKALTHGKVDIMLNADTFKNTTQILREMSAAWEDMTDIERASALELMGGKRQANILASVITNFETVEKVIETSMNSSGSAMAENAKWLDSIEGKTYQFTNALESMWNNMLNSNVIKSFLDFGTEAIYLLDTLPGKIMAVVAALAGFAKTKGVNFFNLGPDITNYIKQYAQIATQLSVLRSKKLGLELGSSAEGWNTSGVNAYANAIKGLTASEQAELLVKQGLNREQITEIMHRAGIEDKVIRETLSKKNLLNTTTLLQAKTVEHVLTTDMAADATQKDAMAAFLAENGHKKLTEALLNEARARGAITEEQYLQQLQNISGSFKNMLGSILKSPGVMMMVGTALAGLISKIETAKEKTEELKEEYSDLQSTISEIDGEIESLDSELEKIQDRIDELTSQDSLSLTDAEELKLLKQQSSELQRQKEIQEQLLSAREEQEDIKSLQMIDNLMKTTAAGQQKAAEDTANAWKIALGAIVAVGAGVAGFFTGGATWAALPTVLGFATAGGMVGAAAGEKIGYNVGLDSKNSGDSLIEWYESYEKAISEAEANAAEAEAEYLSNMTEDNQKKWKEKVEYVNSLQSEMYDGLTNLQDYISNLEYDDNTKDIIDDYNDLMTHLNVKSNEGNIEAQISSIESLKNEFYSLSRGVDENGRNVALSAEEYARYCNIVDQILAYTPSLIQGYNAEGNAILGTADAQYTYNQLIVESIELLRQQRQEAAKQAISDAELGVVVGNAKSNYESAIKGAANYEGLTYGKDNTDLTRTANIISDIIGVGQNGWDKFWGINEADYILENAEAIAEHKDEILQAMADSGHYFGNSLDQYSDWFDGLIQSARDASDQANSIIRERLYAAPEASDYYNDLSGEQLSFINSYISSLDDLKDKTESEIKEIADEIVGITSLIGSSGNLQDSINNLITLDPSSMPVVAYRKKFEELWSEVKDIIPKDKQDQFYAQLFPDANQIDTMIADVQEKLTDASKGLVRNLSLEELRIAYKIIPELSDGINFEELRQEIQEHLPKATGPIVQTYSALTEQVEKFNEVAIQTSEIVLNNTKVTQEYKDSLVELGVSEEELSDCFDTTNGLVVTNAKKLNNLVKSTKKNTTQNVRLAKSQARLQYYELYKKMDLLVGANGEIVDGNIGIVRSLYAEMNALEKTIARYSFLEAQLLGNVNAYEKFKEAQEIDSNTDYIGSAEDMVLALGKAFNTAELGSETAQAAIMGLVPESVYEDLDTLDEKMAAIYNYFKKGKIAQYFDLTFDKDGNIESAEMKLGNLRKFIEDGLSGDNNGDNINPFVGSDWQHFELNQTWLDSLPEGTDILQALADQMNVTKEVAFAFVKSFKDHDIEWLEGDYSTFFDQMLASTNEGKIQLYTERLAGLTMQQAELAEEKNNVIKQYRDGSISEEQYKQKIEEINKKQEELNKSLDDYNKKLAETKNASKQNIFGVGAKGTKYEGKADYQIKTSSEIEATDNIDELDNWIEANEKVKQLYEEQEEAQDAYVDALEEAEAAKDSKDADRIAKANEELKKAEDAYKNVTNAVSEAIKRRDEFAEPTVLEIEVALDEVEKQIESTRKTLDEKLANGTHTITVEIDGQTIQQSVASTDELLDSCFHMDEDGYWVINAGVNKSELEQKYPEILNYVNLLNSNTTLNAYLNDTEAQITIDDLSTQIQEIIDLLEGMKINLDPDSVAEFSRQLGELCKPRNIITYIGSFIEGVTSSGESGPQKVNGTAHARGTAHKSGNWGLQQSEHDALVGELGPEMVVDPSTGRYYTVGDTGAEMVDLPKGAIIFNHKQTEGLLKNGYVTSRGKAYAEGNAHVTIWPDASSKTEWKGTGYSGPDDPTWDAAEALNDSASAISSALSDAADSVEEFEETIDWIEIRMEEFDERIGKLSAELENLTTYEEKNAKISEIVAESQKKYADSLSGAEYYEDYAQKYLAGMNSTLVEAAKNGAIAITEFTKEQDEATVEAIQNYRDYAQKAADLHQQAEEILTEIADLNKQAFDNVANEFDNRLSLIDNEFSQYEAQNDRLETTHGFASEGIYAEMKKLLESNSEGTGKLDILQKQRDAMQAELDTGKIEKYSDAWYDAVSAIAEVDAEIINVNTEINDLQDSMNELHWEKFDLLIKQFQAVSDEAENLLDILGTKDAVDELGNWTDEGIASLGLLAQQMEVAEKQADKYSQEIEYLEGNWETLGYTQEEYIDKLDELKSGQYDAIDSYHDAKDAIVDLNKARVDAIKDGIQKEIDAYEELIQKQKESLDTEKDLHDFQKTVAEQQKNISDIERKIFALSGDNSASARAKRAQLEAELAKAKADLEETYYERSVSNQQDSLDQKLEDFKAQKDAESEELDKYIEKTDVVVADSLATVQANTQTVLDTLKAMQEEYSLNVSSIIMKPWEAGQEAVDTYGQNLNMSLADMATKLGTTVDGMAAKLGITTEELVAKLNITVGDVAKNLGITTEQMAEKLGIEADDLSGMMDATIQELAASMGITLPDLAEKLDTTTAGLAGNLNITLSQFADKMGLTVPELATKFGTTTEGLADKLGITYDNLMGTFGSSMSATVDELKSLEEKYEAILDRISDKSVEAIEKVKKASDEYKKDKEELKKEPATDPNKSPSKDTASQSATRSEEDYYGVALAVWEGNQGWGTGAERRNRLKQKGFDPDKVQSIVNKMGKEGHIHSGAWKGRYYGITSIAPYHYNKYAKGTLSAKQDELAIIDELGEELQLIPGKNGRLEYVKKGTGIVPADLTERLIGMAMNPQEMLDRNRPQIAPSSSVVTTEIKLDCSVGTLVNIEHCDQNTLPDVEKMVNQAFNKHMQNLNNSIKRYTR